MKTFIAINSKDYHNKEKQWQGGNIQTVEIHVIGANNLEEAKKTARIKNNNAWIVCPIGVKNMAYKEA